MRRATIGYCTVIALVLLAAPASAQGNSPAATPSSASQDAPPANQGVAPAADPLPISLTVSGAVSLGAYEAGFLYYMAEVIKRNPESLRLKLVTAASAGSINGFVTALSVCEGHPDAADPQQSSFYRLWSAVGIKQLFMPEKVATLGAFSEEALLPSATIVNDELKKVSWKGCDVVFASSATRQEPYQSLVADKLLVPRQSERFALRIRAMSGLVPEVTNYSHLSLDREQALLPTSGGKIGFGDIRNLLIASSAFPIAFQPKSMTFCSRQRDSYAREDVAALERCATPNARAELFDGGVFDNTPLRTAWRIANAGLPSLGAGLPREWTNSPDPGANALMHYDKKEHTHVVAETAETSRLPFLIYVDPDTTRYPQVEQEPRPAGSGLLPTGYRIVRNLVGTARAAELASLIGDVAGVERLVALTSRGYPTAGGLMFNLLGFYDRKFRFFDFYLGMYDARHFVSEVLTERAKGIVDVLPANAESMPGWQPLLCLAGYLDHDEVAKQACKKGPSNGHDEFVDEDARILLQTSIDKLYSNCVRIKDLRSARAVAAPVPEHVDCRDAMLNKSPPMVEGITHGPDENWRQEEDESELAYTMRLLALHGFHFRDLGIATGSSRRALQALQTQTLDIATTLADKQPTLGQKLLMRLAGRPAVEALTTYSPPRLQGYLGIGRALEGGVLTYVPLADLDWLRLNFALQAKGLDTLVTSAPVAVKLSALGGPVIDLGALTPAGLQLAFSARAGRQFLVAPRGEPDPTDALEKPAFVLQPIVASLTVLSAFRLQAGLEFVRPLNKTDEQKWGRDVLLEACFVF